MAASPLYEGDECKCGHGNPPVARAGVYRGLCEIGREVKRAEVSALQRESWATRRGQRAGSSNGSAPEGEPATERAVERGGVEPPKLSSTIREVLVPAAERLEEALDERDRARISASARLGEFRDALQLVGRVAQTALNRNVVREQAAEEYGRSKSLTPAA